MFRNALYSAVAISALITGASTYYAEDLKVFRLGILGGDRRRATIAEFLKGRRAWNARLDGVAHDA